MSELLTGSCHCGAIKFSTGATPLWSGYCHCASCRRATGAPFTAFFGVLRGTVTWTGLRTEITRGPVTRSFCPHCGTQLTYQSQRWPDETHLYTANLSDLTKVPPQEHYHFAEKLPFVAFDDGLPKWQTNNDGEAAE